MSRDTAQAELERRALAIRARIENLGRPMTAAEELEVSTQLAEIRAELADYLMERMVHQRPEVVSRGKPVSSAAARKGQLEARRRLGERKQFRTQCSDCPAAQTFSKAGGEVAVRCGIERSLLASDTDPQSLLTFCLGDYTNCPSWRAEKERLRDHRPALIGAGEGV